MVNTEYLLIALFIVMAISRETNQNSESVSSRFKFFFGELFFTCYLCIVIILILFFRFDAFPIKKQTNMYHLWTFYHDI